MRKEGKLCWPRSLSQIQGAVAMAACCCRSRAGRSRRPQAYLHHLSSGTAGWLTPLKSIFSTLIFGFWSTQQALTPTTSLDREPLTRTRRSATASHNKLSTNPETELQLNCSRVGASRSRRFGQERDTPPAVVGVGHAARSILL